MNVSTNVVLIHILMSSSKFRDGIHKKILPKILKIFSKLKILCSTLHFLKATLFQLSRSALNFLHRPYYNFYEPFSLARSQNYNIRSNIGTRCWTIIFLKTYQEALAGRICPTCLSFTVPWCQCHHHFTRSFYACRSQKHKKDWQLNVFFTLLGSASVKAVRRTLMKLSHGRVGQKRPKKCHVLF